ncbi:MAG: spermidine synthase [Frankiaceae bacterium]
MPPPQPVVLERVATPRGELVLRRAGPHLEIISNGTFLMDTRDGASERLLVRAALDAAGAAAPRLLIGGLGVGFSLAEACADPSVAAVTVVEIEPALVRWHETHLRAVTGEALRDPRVRLVVADLAEWLATTSDRFDAICLDVDNGPSWTVVPANARLYGAAGLRLLRGRLRPGGALAVWSAAAEPAFELLLRERFADVAVHRVPVRRGEPDVVHVARAARVAG